MTMTPTATRTSRLALVICVVAEVYCVRLREIFGRDEALILAVLFPVRFLVIPSYRRTISDSRTNRAAVSRWHPKGGVRCGG